MERELKNRRLARDVSCVLSLAISSGSETMVTSRSQLRQSNDRCEIKKENLYRRIFRRAKCSAISSRTAASPRAARPCSEDRGSVWTQDRVRRENGIGRQRTRGASGVRHAGGSHR